MWFPPPTDSQPPEDPQGKLNGPTDGRYCGREGLGQTVTSVPQKTWGVVRAVASVHVYMKSTFVYVCVQICIVCSCTCAFVVVCWGWDGGARWFNTRCLKSVGLTACHKTSWLIESPGMSSPAALMNPKPKGLMKRVPFAKTVPQLDLP